VQFERRTEASVWATKRASSDPTPGALPREGPNGKKSGCRESRSWSPDVRAGVAELSPADRVKPDRTAKWGPSTVGEEGASALRSAGRGNLNFPNRRIRTRTYGGVGGE
jgi:hypothetical protein